MESASWSWLYILLILALAGLAVAAKLRPRYPRQAGFEGIEDAAVGVAYDLINRWPQFRLLRRMILQRLKQHQPRGVLVDVGCGPGYLIQLIAKTFPELKVIGVDIAQEMTETAAANLAAQGVASCVSFRLGNSQDLPFDAGEVDFVISTLSLHHWVDPGQALREIRRVLKPGGQFLIFDLRRDAPWLFYGLIHFASRVVVPKPLRRIREPLGSILASYTPLEAQALLEPIPLEARRVTPGFAWIFLWGKV